MSIFKGLKPVFLVSILVPVLLIGACSQPTGSGKEDDSGFVPVTDISGVPTGGVKGSPIDMSQAKAVPAAATHKTIVWSIKDPGRTVLARGFRGRSSPPTWRGILSSPPLFPMGKARERLLPRTLFWLSRITMWR